MKIVVVSDTHLGRKFDRVKFDALIKVFSRGDLVILNGDFWEEYDIALKDFVNSPWSGLFKLLLSKHAIHIFGNHDRKNLDKKYLKLFSKESVGFYEVSGSGVRFRFEHGHLNYPGGLLFQKFLIDPLPAPLQRLALFVSDIPFKLVSFEKWVGMRHNSDLKNRIKPKTDEVQVLVVGHTHFQEIDGESGFLNSGGNQRSDTNWLEIEGSVAKAFTLKDGRPHLLAEHDFASQS